MDRCALFVDAGYMLADGATAVHGTSHRDFVSWDYAGLLRFLTSLSADRTGQQPLRCYWYEATVEGRRTPEHDTLADLPGLTLRLGRTRPGMRDGVEPEIHRDLTTLARNRAVSDVLLVSAEEDLAPVIADVQDLGVRVIIVHISVDGNWTVSRSLRQQCDDIVEVDRTQLRPYVELIAGAEPARFDEPYEVTVYGGKPLANGHGADSGGDGQPAQPAGFTESHPSGPATYTAPAVAEYQPPAEPAVRQPPAPSSPEPAPARDAGPSEPSARGIHRSHAAEDSPQSPGPSPAPGSSPAPQPSPAPGPSPAPQASPPQFSPPEATPPQMPQPQIPSAQPGPPGPPVYAPPAPGSFPEAPASAASAQPVPPGPPAARPGQDLRAARHGAPASPPAPIPPLPSRRGGQHNGRHGDSLRGDDMHGDSLRGDSLRGDGTYGNGLSAPPGPHSPRSQPGSRGHEASHPAASTGYVPQQAAYDAQLPVPSAAGGSFVSGSPAGEPPADIVQAAHSEGFAFGESVTRDAPALWLEAVLARKPRMPSDLEARLLQGSALPIDSLLHDEVRHALRRGFWDALQRSRR